MSEWIERSLRWSLEAGEDYRARPNTEDEERTGWRSFTDSDGYTDRYAVGWRLERQKREQEAKMEAEMAACPYVACTCGHHED